VTSMASGTADGERLARAQAALRDAEVGALLVGPSADLRYLVGYHALPLERLTLLVVHDVREWQSATVEVSGDTPLVVEADGEVLGQTPATFDLLHRVLDLKL